MTPDLARLRARTNAALLPAHARKRLAAERDAADARDAEKDAEIARLREVLRVARGPLAIGASYAGAPGLPLGQKLHAEDCYAALQRITAALEEP